jgi:hypothetical protein
VTLRKQGGVTEEIQVERFGLNSEHAPFLTGCTYNPTVASSMKQSLGPLTIAINLAMATDNKYARSWEAAFAQTFKLLPEVSTLTEAIKGKKALASHILSRLGNICHFGITRNSNKGAIPVAILHSVNSLHSPYTQWLNGDKKRALTDDQMCPSIKNIDSSGHGMWNVWNKASECKLSMVGDPSVFTKEFASEALFLAVFGMHKEDLALLEYMTGRRFSTRKEMGECFRARASASMTVGVEIIRANIICKLASAAQTQLLKGGSGQISRSATTSGKWQQRVDVSSKILQTTADPRHVSAGFGTDPYGRAIQMLDSVLTSLRSEVSAQQKVEWGTTEWYRYDPSTLGAAYGEQADRPVVTNSRYFYSQS